MPSGAGRGLMRIVIDTNILISSLMTTDKPPHLIAEAWRSGQVDVLTSEEQIAELGRVVNRPKVAKYFRRSGEAGPTSWSAATSATCCRSTRRAGSGS